MRTTNGRRDAFAEQHSDLERLVLEHGIPERHAFFFETGEGKALPDKTEELSGYVVDVEGKVHFFWLGWDENRQAKALTTWKQVTPDPRWLESVEYRQALETVGLSVR